MDHQFPEIEETGMPYLQNTQMVVRPDRFGIQMRLADRFFLGVRQMAEKRLRLPEMTKD
jgi:hypothetical protein